MLFVVRLWRNEMWMKEWMNEWIIAIFFYENGDAIQFTRPQKQTVKLRNHQFFFSTFFATEC